MDCQWAGWDSRCRGKILADDYRHVVVPAIAGAGRTGDVRALLVSLANRYESLTQVVVNAASDRQPPAFHRLGRFASRLILQRRARRRPLSVLMGV